MIERKERELSELSEHKGKLAETRVHELEDVIQARDQELVAINSKFAQFTTDYRYNLKLLEDRDSELERLDASVVSLKNEAASREEALTKARRSQAECEAEILKLRQRSDELEAFYAEKLDRTTKSLEEARSGRDAELIRQRAEFEQSEAALQRSLEERRAELEQQRREAVTQAEERLSQAETEARTRLDDAEREARKLETRAKNAERELATTLEDKERIGAELASTVEALRESEAECRRIADTLADTTSAAEATETSLRRELEIQAEQHEIALREHESQLEELEVNIARAQESFEEERRQMREEAEKAADEAAKELVAANDEIDEAKRREGDARTIAKKAQDEVQMMLNRLSQQGDAMAQERAMLQQQVASMQGEYSNANQRHRDEMSNLSQMAADERARLERLASEMRSPGETKVIHEYTPMPAPPPAPAPAPPPPPPAPALAPPPPPPQEPPRRPIRLGGGPVAVLSNPMLKGHLTPYAPSTSDPRAAAATVALAELSAAAHDLASASPQRRPIDVSDGAPISHVSALSELRGHMSSAGPSRHVPVWNPPPPPTATSPIDYERLARAMAENENLMASTSTSAPHIEVAVADGIWSQWGIHHGSREDSGPPEMTAGAGQSHALDSTEAELRRRGERLLSRSRDPFHPSSRDDADADLGDLPTAGVDAATMVYDFENAGVERNLPNVERARERVLQAKYQLERNAHVPQLVAATASSRSAGAFALASMAAKASRAGGGVGMMNAAKLARRTPKRLESRIADLRGS